MRARSIPEEHEAKVLRLYLAGESHHAIADRLDAEDGVDTSGGSVHRLIERIAEGDCSDGVLRTVTKIRQNAPKLADRIARHTMIAHKMAGFDEPVEVPAGITPQQLDFASRMTIRELKVAGCLGRDVDRAFERARALAEETCLEEEEEMEEIREAARRHLKLSAQKAAEAAARGPTAISAEGPAPTSESAARPFAQPPPEPMRASSNGRFSPPLAPVAAPPKQGRNEPCACGSGVKFKRCCDAPVGRPRVAPELQAVAS